MRFFQQLSVRLFLLLTALLVGAFAVYMHLNYSVYRLHLKQHQVNDAKRLSEVIIRSTHHAMLENNRDHVDQIITSIGEQPQVEVIRVYSKSGEAVVSTNAEEVGHLVDTEAEACAACHEGGDLRHAVTTDELTREFTNASGHPVVGMITPILNEPKCSVGDCHPSVEEQRILGVLDMQLSREEDVAHLAKSRDDMVSAGLFVWFVTALASWAFIAVLVRSPIKKLIGATQAIGRLELDVGGYEQPGGVIGDLARSVELMAAALRKAQAENQEWSASLEAKVQEKTRELQHAQVHLVHAEKMASLGKLSAIVAHEINNPLASVRMYARTIARSLRKNQPVTSEKRARLLDQLAMIDSETARCGETVKNMLLFAKRTPEGLRQVSLGEVLDRSARLLQHGLDLAQVEFEIESSDLDDRIVCNADQIHQMFVALIVNAIEAMPDGGSIRVRLSESGEDAVLVTIRDTGGGIPEELRKQVFEPFFTTKEGSSGVGLGLAVVHGVVERHGGSIEIGPNGGEGATFHILLPRKPRNKAEDPQP